MPDLVVFAACEKVLIDAQTNSASLISLMHQVEIPAPEGTIIPADANSLMRWSALSAWAGRADEKGVKFEQRIAIVLPDAEQLLFDSMFFEIEEDQQEDKTYNIAEVTGFPIAQAGECKIVLSYRKAETQDPWEVVAEYPVRVVHRKEPVPQSFPKIIKG